MQRIVTLTDGTHLEATLTGQPAGRFVMVPGAKKPVYGAEAERLKPWGVDPEGGRRLVEGLADSFRVLHFDYESHLLANPRPDRLTPDSIADDFQRIADALGARTFSYYGYSWLALAGLQLALRTDRLESLVMGGFPPYGGPYREMLTVTAKSHEQALVQQSESSEAWPAASAPDPENTDWSQVKIALDPRQTKQFRTLYESLREFDDTQIQQRLTVPRLAFAGEADTIVYGDSFGGVTVDPAGLLRRHAPTLRSLGWDVELLGGADMDHAKAMQPAAVLPLIRPWLIARLISDRDSR